MHATVHHGTQSVTLQQLISDRIVNNKQCSTLLAAAHRPSWRMICSGFIRLFMMLLNGRQQMIRKLTHHSFTNCWAAETQDDNNDYH